MKKKKDQPLQDRISQLTGMIKDTSLGRKNCARPGELKDYFDLDILEKVYKSFLKKGNEKAFLKGLDIPKKRWDQILVLLKQFNSLVQPSSEGKDGENRFQYFVNALGNFADFHVCQLVKKNLSCLYVRFVNPPLDCLKGDLLFFHVKGETAVQEMQQFINVIESQSQEYLRKVAFVLAPSGDEPFLRLAQESPYKFVLLSPKSIKEIILADSPQIEFHGVITRQLDLLDIQPYRTHGSTPIGMFFGRKREIDWILNDPTMSVAIYGGRQLGKTSLLRKVQERLGEEGGETTVFITCEGIQNNLSLGLEILKQLSLDIKKIKNLSDFEEMLRDHLRTQRGHFTFIIDEVDDLVDLDRRSSRKIFVALRNIKNDFPQKCRFFFAGFKKLYSEFYRLYAPFRNFAEPCELKSLSKKEARKLIEEPLCMRLGIKFQSKKKITAKIHDYTGGHPCFIQHYCKCLIEQISGRKNRLITEEDVEKVYQSEAYRNLVIGNYSDNFREGEEKGDIVPKLLICHIIFEEIDGFTENKVLTSLKKSKIDMEPFRLRSELRKLTMTSVLEKVGNLYRFTNSVYPQILKESENLPDILIQLMEEYERFRESDGHQSVVKDNSDRFTLRQDILNQIGSDSERSYAVVGGNGFGKTSLLKSLQEIYQLDLSYHSIFCQAGDLERSDELLGALLESVDMGEGHPRHYWDILNEFIADENQQGHRTALLIDDVDGLIQKDDRGFKSLLKDFEQLSIKLGEGFRVILSGGSSLYSLVSQKPFPKTMEVVHLKPLDERDSRSLLAHIFKEKGNLKLDDETLEEFILAKTGGNPTLVERFVHLLSQKLSSPRICEEDLEELVEEGVFQKILLEIYEDTWDQTQLDLVHRVMEKDKGSFTPGEVATSGKEEEKKIRDEFSRFSLLGFFKRTGRKYKFSNPYYKECFHWRKKTTS